MGDDAEHVVHVRVSILLFEDHPQHLLRLLELAEVIVRPRGEHEQPRAVPRRDPGRGKRLVQ